MATAQKIKFGCLTTATGFNETSIDTADTKPIVFVKDTGEPFIYTQSFKFKTLPNWLLFPTKPNKTTLQDTEKTLATVQTVSDIVNDAISAAITAALNTEV